MRPPIEASAEALFEYICEGISHAATDPSHAWRFPVLITGGAGRVVVLRSADKNKGTWSFYTDSRTPKVAQIASEKGSGAATFYDPNDRSQLRLYGKIVHAEALERKQIWEGLSVAQKSSYGASAAPGSALAIPSDGLSETWKAGSPTAEEQRIAFSNFAVYIFQIKNSELLLLNHESNRRCLWQGWNSGKFTWLTP